VRIGIAPEGFPLREFFLSARRIEGFDTVAARSGWAHLTWPLTLYLALHLERPPAFQAGVLDAAVALDVEPAVAFAVGSALENRAALAWFFRKRFAR